MTISQDNEHGGVPETSPHQLIADFPVAQKYVGCKSCPGNCDPFETCYQAIVGASGRCYNIEPALPTAQFNAANILSCDGA